MLPASRPDLPIAAKTRPTTNATEDRSAAYTMDAISNKKKRSANEVIR